MGKSQLGVTDTCAEFARFIKLSNVGWGGFNMMFQPAFEK